MDVVKSKLFVPENVSARERFHSENERWNRDEFTIDETRSGFESLEFQFGERRKKMVFFSLMEYIIGGNYFSGRIFMVMRFCGKMINCFFCNGFCV